MKLPVVTLICCFLCYFSVAQGIKLYKKDSVHFKEIEQVYFSLNQRIAPNIKKALPYSRVVVHDVRFDTSFIALYPGRTTFKGFRSQKLNLSGGLDSGITAYLDTCFKELFTDNGSEMICYFKKFTLTGVDTLIEDYLRTEVVFRAKVEVECFYKTNEMLFPAFKHDTIYTQRANKLKDAFSSIIAEMLEPLAQKLVWMDSSLVVKKKSLTQEEVANRYRERFNIPILTTSKYMRGVYKNRREFLQNAPSITKFSVKESSSGTYYLVDSNNNVITPSTFVGFCDGKNIWLVKRDSWYPLYRVGNSFEMFYTNGWFGGRSVRIVAGLKMED